MDGRKAPFLKSTRVFFFFLPLFQLHFPSFRVTPLYFSAVPSLRRCHYAPPLTNIQHAWKLPTDPFLFPEISLPIRPSPAARQLSSSLPSLRYDLSFVLSLSCPFSYRSVGGLFSLFLVSELRKRAPFFQFRQTLIFLPASPPLKHFGDRFHFVTCSFSSPTRSCLFFPLLRSLDSPTIVYVKFLLFFHFYVLFRQTPG